MEDIQPAKIRAAPPKKTSSIQKSIQELTQEFKDLLSEKVCTVPVQSTVMLKPAIRHLKSYCGVACDTADVQWQSSSCQRTQHERDEEREKKSWSP